MTETSATTPDKLWPDGAATGIGSHPGTDMRSTLRLVLDELPDLAYLPELPDRGPGADLIGRGACLLIDMFVDLQPSGWRLVPNPGVDQRRGLDWLDRDLDTLEELAGEYDGTFKVQAAGPWTLAATIELHRGDKVVSDPGATRDLTQSLAEGLAAHVADVRRRMPAATVLLQLDEPSLPQVIAGRVPTASGFGVLREVEAHVAEAGLAEVIGKAGVPAVVHCCAPQPPVGLIHAAGAAVFAADLRFLLDPRGDDPLGEAIEQGMTVFLGVVPGVPPAATGHLPPPEKVAADVRGFARRMGVPPASLSQTFVPTPGCGMAGATPEYVVAALRTLRKASAILAEDPEG